MRNGWGGGLDPLFACCAVNIALQHVPLQQRCLLLSEQIKFDRSIHTKLDFIPQRRCYFVSSKREGGSGSGPRTVFRICLSPIKWRRALGVEPDRKWQYFLMWRAKCGCGRSSSPSLSSRLLSHLSDLLTRRCVWWSGVGCQSSMTARLRRSVLRFAPHKPTDLEEQEKNWKTKTPQRANINMQLIYAHCFDAGMLC